MGERARGLSMMSMDRRLGSVSTGGKDGKAASLWGREATRVIGVEDADKLELTWNDVQCITISLQTRKTRSSRGGWKETLRVSKERGAPGLHTVAVRYAIEWMLDLSLYFARMYGTDGSAKAEAEELLAEWFWTPRKITASAPSIAKGRQDLDGIFRVHCALGASILTVREMTTVQTRGLEPSCFGRLIPTKFNGLPVISVPMRRISGAFSELLSASARSKVAQKTPALRDQAICRHRPSIYRWQDPFGPKSVVPNLASVFEACFGWKLNIDQLSLDFHDPPLKPRRSRRIPKAHYGRRISCGEPELEATLEPLMPSCNGIHNLNVKGPD
ncbi:hypothetical protein C8F01DRAFT_1239632 [Mycena amicta]|nr:hypothetical protein C8F01DRAFT_1239632 [Mycena amicta]